MSESQKIDNLLHEERRFPPSPEFQSTAIAGPELYEQASADRLNFWATQSRELLHWHTGPGGNDVGNVLLRNHWSAITI